MNTNFMGFDGFVWFIGVVEENNDLEQLGRVKVRCLGIHTEDKNELPTDDLPWATPLMPVTSASLSQVGQSPTGLLNGSWVMGFFRDGKSAQEPIVMGSFFGLPTEKPNTDLGFCDPRGIHPVELNEPDTARSARGDRRANSTKTRTTAINQGHRDDTPASDDETGRGLKSVANKPIAWNTNSWQSFAVPYNARYPYNKVMQTESGHVVEFDDTPDNERILIWHRKDSFIEIDKDGNTRIHSYGVGEILVDLNLNIECKSDINIYCHGTTNIYSDKNIDMQSEENVRIKCKNFQVLAEDTVDIDGNHIDMDANRIDMN